MEAVVLRSCLPTGMVDRQASDRLEERQNLVEQSREAIGRPCRGLTVERKLKGPAAEPAMES